jgi:hypothetical protein
VTLKARLDILPPAQREGGDLDTLDESTRGLLVRESVADLDVPSMPILSARLDA